MKRYFLHFLALALLLLGLSSSLRADTVLTTLTVQAGPGPVAVNPVTDQIFVVDLASTPPALTVLDGATGAIVATVTLVSAPNSMAVNVVTNMIYVADAEANSVLAIDAGNNFNTTSISVGNAPQAMVVDPIGNLIYVANSADSTVTVIDGSLNQTLQTVNVGTSPTAIAIDTLTNLIYVANFGNGSAASTVTVIDANNSFSTTNVNVGVGPTALAVNPANNQIYVVNTFDNTVTVIDPDLGATNTITVGTNPTGVAVNPATNEAYVTCQVTGSLSVINGATAAFSSTAAAISIGGSADALSLNPATNKIYVVDKNDNALVVVDGATTAASAPIPVGTAPAGVVVNPLTDRIFVTNGGTNTVTVVDGSDNAAATVTTGTYPHGVAANPVTNQIYVADFNSNQVTVVDGATKATTTIAAGAGPYDVAVNPVTNRIYVGNFNGATVTVIDGASGNTSVAPVSSAPIAVAVNPVTNQIYTANFESASVSVIDGATNNSTTIPTAANPIAIAVNSVTNQIYVANYAGDSVTIIDGPTNLANTINGFNEANAIAVNPVTNQIYVVSQGTGTTASTVTVMDGATNNTSTVNVGVQPVAVAVNSRTNKIYVANQNDSTVTVIDANNGNQTSTINLSAGPNALVVNEATNQIYVATNSTNLSVIDGASGAVSVAAAGSSPLTMGLNPATGQVYLCNSGANNLSIVTPAHIGQSGLETGIAGLPNDTADAGTNIQLVGIDLYDPNPTPIQQIYYQLDSVLGPWNPGATAGAQTNVSLSGLSAGPHTIYAFATDGGESSSAIFGQGSSVVPGRIAAYSFVAGLPSVGRTFSFAQTTATAYNTDTAALVTVQRNFGVPATVSYLAVSGTAVEGINFQATSGTLSFGQGQLTNTISVPLINNDLGASEAEFTVLLADATGAATVGSPDTIEVFLLNATSSDVGLSDFTAIQPTGAPAANGSLTVNLTPTAANGQWRLFGELAWRNSGATVSGLIAADYVVEYKPVSGYQAPDNQTVTIAGSLATAAGTYTATANAPAGAVTVNLSPANTGGWRFQGEETYRAGGSTVTGLNAGDYIIEFEPATGLATPESCDVIVAAGQTSTLDIAYLAADSTTGATPSLVDTFSSFDPRVNPSESYTGQIQTDEGLGTGFVPLDRVVVTAVHVLFDDASLSYVTGIRWFFQHDTGSFEAPPQVPRGFYALDGYAAQRAIDNSPGISSTASQELDVAAMFFLEPAARGGQSGYLASNSPTNIWLTNSGGNTPRDKFIAGYPASGVDPSTVGRLYATPIVQDAFSYVTGSLFKTTAVTSYHGNSGGPLFVGYEDPVNGETFYPAAVYLGGAAQTVVRAIDGQTIELMNNAEASGNGGPISTSPGIIEMDAGITGNLRAAFGGIDINILPTGAVAAGALWSLPGDTAGRQTGASALNLTPGSYQITFNSVPGYTAPSAMTLTVTAGQTTMTSATYTPLPPVITSAGSATILVGQSFHYQVTASPAASSFALTGNLPTGLTFNTTTGVISGTPTGTGSFSVMITPSNSGGPGAASSFKLTVGVPGELVVTTSGSGTVTSGFAGTTLQAVGSSITIQATPGKGAVFVNWTSTDSSGNTTVVWHHPIYTFAMPELLNLQANFINNPFTRVAGVYNGLVAGTVDALSARGSISLTVAATGAVTGTVQIGAKHYTVKGAFDATGAFSGLASGTPSEPAEILSFQLDLSGASKSVTGKAIAGATSLNVAAYLTPFTAKSPAPQALGSKTGAKYTLALPHSTGTGLPGGDGYGTVTVSPTGAIRFVGVLGDGTTVSESASLGPTGQWPFFQLLYSSGGALTGPLKIQLPGNTPAIVGSLDWFKPSGKTPYYPNGFTTNVTAVGEALTATPLTGLTQATLTLGQGGLSQAVGPFTVNFNSKGVGTVTGTGKFTMTITASTGLFTGKFPDASNTLHTFNGVLLPQTGSNAAAGYGLFLGLSQQTGAVEF